MAIGRAVTIVIISLWSSEQSNQLILLKMVEFIIQEKIQTIRNHGNYGVHS